MDAVLPIEISAAVIVAVTCVEDAKVVVRALPLKLTTEFETKFVPFTVRVNEVPPAVTEVGEIEVVVGAELLTAIALLKVEVTEAEVAQIFMLSANEYFIAV